MNKPCVIRLLFAVALLSGLFVANRGFAQILVYEPFDYAAGAVDGTNQAGGVGMAVGGWTTSGSQEYQAVVTPGLTFTGLTSAGNALRRNNRDGNSETHRGISGASQTDLTANGSTIWFSVLLDTETSFPKSNNLTFLLATGAVDDPSAATMGVAGGGEGIGIAFLPDNGGASLTALVVDDGVSSRSTNSIGTFSGNDLLFIAGQIDWAPNGSDDTLTVYEITDPTAALPPASFATVAADLDQSQFDTLAIGDKQRTIIDEIRFARTFEEVMGRDPRRGMVIAVH